MKKLILIVSVALIFAVCVFLLTDYHEESYHLSTNFSDFSSSKLWSKSLRATDLDKSTANLECFRINTDNGKIKSLRFSFWGLTPSNELVSYKVSMNSKGELFFVEKTSKFSMSTVHPLTFLNRLEQANILQDACTIEASVASEVDYSKDGYRVYAIKEGRKIPLQEASVPAYHIEVWSFSPEGRGEAVYLLWQDLPKKQSIQGV